MPRLPDTRAGPLAVRRARAPGRRRRPLAVHALLPRHVAGRLPDAPPALSARRGIGGRRSPGAGAVDIAWRWPGLPHERVQLLTDRVARPRLSPIGHAPP